MKVSHPTLLSSRLCSLVEHANLSGFKPNQLQHHISHLLCFSRQVPEGVGVLRMCTGLPLLFFHSVFFVFLVCISGKWQYELMLGSKGVMQVGWITSNCKFSHEVSEYSWRGQGTLWAISNYREMCMVTWGIPYHVLMKHRGPQSEMYWKPLGRKVDSKTLKFSELGCAYRRSQQMVPRTVSRSWL